MTAADIMNALTIFGPNRPRIRGRTKRNTNVKRVIEQTVSISREFYKVHNRFTITADVMFVSGVPFLVTLSRRIKFRTTQFLPKLTARTLADSQ